MCLSDGSIDIGAVDLVLEVKCYVSLDVKENYLGITTLLVILDMNHGSLTTAVIMHMDEWTDILVGPEVISVIHDGDVDKSSENVNDSDAIKDDYLKR